VLRQQVLWIAYRIETKLCHGREKGKKMAETIVGSWVGYMEMRD
jgi:hypothetical protein